MQWCEEPQAGFSSAKKTVLPVISKGPYSYTRVNVEAQRRDPTSMLSWIERMIRLRKECPEFGWGKYEIIGTRDSSVLGIRYEWRNNAIVTLHNFSDKPKSATVDLGKGADRMMNLLIGEHSQAGPDGKHKIVLEGYGYRWYRVGGLDYIINREKY